MVHHSGSITRRLAACATAACIVGSLATPAALAQSGTGTPLILNFNTASLGTFPTVSGSTYGVWSNGQTVSDSNVYVSFMFSAAGLSPSVTGTNFYAVIGGTSLRWSGTVSSGTWGAQAGGGWYFNDLLSGTGVLSPAFSVASMNASGGTQVYHLQGQNIYIEYGQNTIGSGTSNWAYVLSGSSNTNAPPPSTVNPLMRYTDVEMTYVPGGGLGGGQNNADLTAINNIGSALGLIYTATTNVESKVRYTGYTQDLLPHLQTLTSTSNLVVATTQTGTPSAVNFGGTGTLIAGILSAAQTGTGATTISNANFLASYPAYIQNALTNTLGSPLLTNQPGGPSPSASALQYAQGFTGPDTGGSGTASQQVSMFFRPTFTAANQSYDITLTGSIAATLGSGSGATTTWYGTGTAGSLTINVSNIFSGTANQGFYGYLANGNVNNSVVTLGGVNNTGSGTSGGGWQQFSTDFWQNGGNAGGSGNQGGPSPDLFTSLSTSGTTDSTYYGQIVQRALGDLQELLMIGAFGNPSVVTLTGTDYSFTGPLGNAPSQNVWSEKSNAYLNLTGTAGFNPLGKYLWEHSQNVSTSGTTAGAVYSNPYDDRFSNSGGVTLPLGDYGGTLTIDLREIPAVPEPSAVALLSVAGATLGGLGWLRQRRGAA